MHTIMISTSHVLHRLNVSQYLLKSGYFTNIASRKIKEWISLTDDCCTLNTVDLWLDSLLLPGRFAFAL